MRIYWLDITDVPTSELYENEIKIICEGFKPDFCNEVLYNETDAEIVTERFGDILIELTDEQDIENALNKASKNEWTANYFDDVDDDEDEDEIVYPIVICGNAECWQSTFEIEGYGVDTRYQDEMLTSFIDDALRENPEYRIDVNVDVSCESDFRFWNGGSERFWNGGCGYVRCKKDAPKSVQDYCETLYDAIVKNGSEYWEGFKKEGADDE